MVALHKMPSFHLPAARHFMEELPNWPGQLFLSLLSSRYEQAEELKYECVPYSLSPLPTYTQKAFWLFQLGQEWEASRECTATYKLLAKVCYAFTWPMCLIGRIVDFFLGFSAAFTALSSKEFEKKRVLYAIKHLPLHFFAADTAKIVANIFYFPSPPSIGRRKRKNSPFSS
jgi:hypothetical protein